MVIDHSVRNFETQITLITQIDSGCENQCNLCLNIDKCGFIDNSANHFFY